MYHVKSIIHYKSPAPDMTSGITVLNNRIITLALIIVKSIESYLDILGLSLGFARSCPTVGFHIVFTVVLSGKTRVLIGIVVAL